MATLINTLIETLQTVNQQFDVVALPSLEKPCKELESHIQGLSPEEKEQVAQAFYHYPCAFNNQAYWWSFLFQATKDFHFFKALLELRHSKTDTLHELNAYLWYLIANLFQHAKLLPDTEKDHIQNELLRPFYQQQAQRLRNTLDKQELHSLPLAVSIGSKKMERIGILANQFSGHTGHSPTRLACILAEVLVKDYGKQVYLINTNNLPHAPYTGYYGGLLYNYNQGLLGKQAITINPDVQINSYTARPGIFYPSWIKEYAHYASQEQLDGLFVVGQCLFAQDYFYNKLPMVHLATSVDLPYTRSNHLCLINGQLEPYQQKAIDSVCESHCYDFTLLSLLDSSTALNRDTLRQQLGIPTEAYVFAIVGNRLSQEVNDAFLSICKRLLAANPKVHLAFVGLPSAPEGWFTPSEADSKRVHYFGYQSDLRAFYRACDAYLNPFRSGGGTSGQMAMVDGLAVVTLDNTDVATCVRSALACSDLEAYEQLALRLINEPGFHASFTTQLAAVVAEVFDNRKEVGRLLRLLEEVADRPAFSAAAKLLSASV